MIIVHDHGYGYLKGVKHKLLSRYARLHILENSSQEFFLTGSWFFGENYRDSNVDLYTTPGCSIGPLGNLIGYDRELSNYYDSNTTCMYSTFSGEINVQIVKDLNKKHMVQEALLCSETLRSVLYSGETKPVVQRREWSYLPFEEQLKRFKSLPQY